MGSPRRETDSEDEDYSRQRGGSFSLNGHAKWVVSVVGAAILGVAGWGIQQDRAQVERRLLAVETTAAAVQMSQTRTEVQLEEIQHGLARIEKSLEKRNGR